LIGYKRHKIIPARLMRMKSKEFEDMLKPNPKFKKVSKKIRSSRKFLNVQYKKRAGKVKEKDFS
jgi:hypothetical protein